MKKTSRKIKFSTDRFMPSSWSVKEMLEEFYEWDFDDESLMRLLLFGYDELDFISEEDAKNKDVEFVGDKNGTSKKIRVRAILNLSIEEVP